MGLGLLKNIRLMLLFVSDGWPHLKKESDTKKYIYYIYIYIKPLLLIKLNSNSEPTMLAMILHNVFGS